MNILYRENGKPRAYVTMFFIVCTVAVWCVMEFFGDTLSGSYVLEHGGMYPASILEQGEWYRLFTSVFIHFGADHLANNMIILLATGDKLEDAVGKWRFFLIYIGAGLCGNLLSLYEMVKTGDYAVGAGASGAIFGIIGALVWIAVRNHGQFEGLTTRGLLLMILLCLYYGFTTMGVDNWAHIGGALSGFALCFILTLFMKTPEEELIF